MSKNSAKTRSRAVSISYIKEKGPLFLDGVKQQQPNPAIIDQLCAWSFSPQSLEAKAANSVIFGGIIEPLCNDFSERGVQAGNLVLTRILQFIRATSEGAALDQLLNIHGFTNAAALLNRYQRIRQPAPLTDQQKSAVKKILILSRVTAGADIAITSVFIHRLRLRFAEAELVLIGPGHLPEIFASVPNCHHRSFVYKNDSSLFGKMTSWPRLLEIAQHEQEGHSPEEILLLDPDTRLTQLGLLPLAPDNCTCYFPSRSIQPEATSGRNLSSLANQWLNHLLDERQVWVPKLVFQTEKNGYQAFCQSVRHLGCRLVVTINFGVGNDPGKKVLGSFEEDLIQALLSIPDIVVILDTGRGDQTTQWIADLLAHIQRRGINAACLTDGEIFDNTITFGHGLIIFNGSLGSLGMMIDAADCFIGYDSCGQHLAAATRTPSVIVFAGAPSARFIERWSPNVPGNLTIPTDGLATAPREINALIQQITRYVESLRPRQ